jgi:putative transposase
MTVSRPVVLQAGDEVRLGNGSHTVVAVSAAAVRLADVTGAESVMPLVRVLADPAFALITPRGQPARLPPEGLLGQLPAAVAERARWWERHIIEVLTGLPPGSAPGAVPRPEYDPARCSVRQREIAKVAELSAAGHRVGLSTLQRQRREYETAGLWGLVDRRFTRPAAPGGRVDPRVVEAVRQAVGEETSKSTGTRGRLRRRAGQILAEAHGPDAPALPAKTTFYRLVEQVSQGKHTFGSARTRRSLAKQPAGPFGTVTAVRPGEWMQVDTTPLDVRVVLDNGLLDRAELTWMIDLATRTITAAVLRPSTKAVDAALLLARTLTPEPMRPGWPDALRMCRSVLPHRQLAGIDERLAHAAARPVIVPETIVCDHGMVYMSQTFRNACRAMGISIQPAHKGSPWEKGTVETSFHAVGTLFAQYVAGYVGNSVEHRGEHADQEAVWPITELQELLDEWIVAVWQNRPHDGLRDPLTPGVALSPNEKYAALVETAGYVAAPLSAEDYIELLPVTWRVINSYGIRLGHRTYDGQALNPYRRQPSGITAKKGLWEVHHDPYDVTRIWVRNHHDGGWITLPWTHLKTSPAPFGELAWQHARKQLARRGRDRATEQEITDAVSALLERAGRGPPTEQTTASDDRVAARTRATARAARPTVAVPASPPPDSPSCDQPAAEDTDLAEVIPLGVFDARKEAEQWW